MGYNTVAFLLNDQMHTLKDSPNAVLFKLCHPPHWSDPGAIASIDAQVASVARDHGERVPHPQALEVLPTFHADMTKFFRAGQNSIVECQVLRYGKNRKTGKKTVTLELPDWG